ncbi:hypothetical protein [Candidatus Leptofilum sp.]|uniref:hypothetical protein n=1 Tax=Candidatus Leptofilum sp. TaxID=3241576 RepID=UPI003B596B98
MQYFKNSRTSVQITLLLIILLLPYIVLAILAGSILSVPFFIKTTLWIISITFGTPVIPIAIVLIIGYLLYNPKNGKLKGLFFSIVPGILLLEIMSVVLLTLFATGGDRSEEVPLIVCNPEQTIASSQQREIILAHPLIIEFNQELNLNQIYVEEFSPDSDPECFSELVDTVFLLAYRWPPSYSNFDIIYTDMLRVVRYKDGSIEGGTRDFDLDLQQLMRYSEERITTLENEPKIQEFILKTELEEVVPLNFGENIVSFGCDPKRQPCSQTAWIQYNFNLGWIVGAMLPNSSIEEWEAFPEVNGAIKYTEDVLSEQNLNCVLSQEVGEPSFTEILYNNGRNLGDITLYFSCQDILKRVSLRWGIDNHFSILSITDH